MSRSAYRAVIVGLTGIGARRPEEDGIPVYGTHPNSHAGAYWRHPGAEVVAVCDLRQEALTEFKDLWDDVWPEVKLYTDYREMLEKETPDLVSVATSDHLHADITVAAAELGARGIFCEKPVATRLEDADRMIAAAEANGVCLSVDHTRRWYPSHLQAREIVRSGELGALRTILADMCAPRAMLFRNGTHLIDMICFYAESDTEWVMGDLEEGFEHFTEYKAGGGRDAKEDPHASAYIKFKNGVRAFVNLHKVNFSPPMTLTMTCETGKVVASDDGISLIRRRGRSEPDISEIRQRGYSQAYQTAALTEMIEGIENGGALVSSGREARKTLEIMLGILRSHEEGNARVNFPISDQGKAP